MYVGLDFSPQEPEESEVIGLDFVYDVDHDETLLSSTWDMWVVAGVDPNPNHFEGPSMEVVPIGSSLKTGTVIRIGGLLPGVTYRVRAKVVTTKGNSRNLWSHIRGVTPNS